MLNPRIKIIILISTVVRASNIFKWIHFVASTFGFVPFSSNTIDICQTSAYVSPLDKWPCNPDSDRNVARTLYVSILFNVTIPAISFLLF
jgi:hypothetical protein